MKATGCFRYTIPPSRVCRVVGVISLNGSFGEPHPPLAHQTSKEAMPVKTLVKSRGFGGTSLRGATRSRKPQENACKKYKLGNRDHQDHGLTSGASQTQKKEPVRHPLPEAGRLTRTQGQVGSHRCAQEEENGESNKVFHERAGGSGLPQSLDEMQGDKREAEHSRSR